VALDAYDRLGYVPYTAAKERVNETLDNAFGDYCIARAAEKLGEEEIREKYDARSLGYRQLFDPETGFIRGKDENGEFRSEEFDPFMWGRDYTEGSVWQNGFGAYHDIEGMNALYGGKLSEKIDELMATPPTFHVGSYNRVIHEMTEMAAVEYGQCAISNQPSFHVPFLYSALGDAEKTSYHLSNLLERFRLAEGFPGDEDNGSMASYFVLASLGLYQIAPSRPVYQCARPYFERVEIDLENGKTLTVTQSAYPEKMRGEISYADLMAGGEVGEKVAL
jgi:predicted alpha-1,2-mannosidase